MRYPLMRNNILAEDLEAVIAHLRSDDPKLTNGPKVREFEKAWSEWLGVPYSVFVNSGASANYITMQMLKLKFPEGGDVIVPPLTWISDIASVIQAGFNPVFVDVDPRTLGMCSDAVIARLNGETRAVFLSHIQGFNALTEKLMRELERREILLIEDVCESHGARHGERKLGSLGWASNFSFYYAHHMSTIEGGMICTFDRDVYESARILRSHGMVRESDDPVLRERYLEENPHLNPEFIFAYPSFNFRNTEIGGIIGLSQIRRLDQVVKRRTENFLYFLENLDERMFWVDFETVGSSNYAFNIVCRDADEGYVKRLMRAMDDQGVEYRRGSAGGGNQLRQPYLRAKFEDGYHLHFPVTEHIHFYGFYIGNFPTLELSDISNICRILNRV